MSLVKIKDSYIEFANTKYFTGNAQKVSIGSIGEKATPFGGKGKLEVKDHIPAPKLDGKIKTAGPFEIDTAQSSKSNFTKVVEGSLKAIGFSGSESLIYDELEKRHLKLVQLFVEEEDMKTAANNSPKARNNLESYGGDGRIAHELFVVMEAEYATSFTSGARFEVSADAGGVISITASGGKVVRGKDKVTLAPGTGLAYSLLNPNWKKGLIEKTTVDEPGLN